MATITKRGEHQYQAEIRRKGYPAQTQTFETRIDAQKWARAQETKIDEGQFRDLRVIANTTLGDALDRYMTEIVPRKAIGGQRHERNRIRLIKKHALAQRLVSTLQACDFVKYRNERELQVGPNAVRLELALLSHLYTVAKRDWSWPIERVLKDVKRPSAPDGRSRRFDSLNDPDDEMEKEPEETRLLRSAQHESVRKPIWLTACIRLSLATGLRAGELLTLEWSQVDLKNGIVSLTKARNGSTRSVGLTLEAVQVLRDLPQQGSKVIAGYHETGKLDCDFKAACVVAEIADFHFHDLRHEAATRFAPHMQMVELAKVMGWRTLQMAMRYYNPTPSELAAKMRKVESARLSASSQQQALRGDSTTNASSQAPSDKQPDQVASSNANVIRVEFAKRVQSAEGASRRA